MNFTEQDHAWMMRAIGLARLGLGRVSPNPPVGCVLLRDGQVVGEGYHKQCGGPHAERNALATAGERAAGATAYVTLMPCNHQGRTPPCTQGLIDAGVRRVIVAVDDPDPVSGDGASALRAAGVHVDLGCCTREAAMVMRGFLKFAATGLPFVTLKYAMSLDGKIASTSGDSKWISGEISRDRVQALRSESDAVMVGIGTVQADDPRLNVRHAKRPQPRRVIVDSTALTSPKARLFQEDGGEVILLTTDYAPEVSVERLRRVGATVIRVADQKKQVDLEAALQMLGGMGVRTVFCEGGARLAGALMQASLVDEINAFVAPVILGGDAPGPLAGEAAESMAEALRLAPLQVEPSGGDAFLQAPVGDWPWLPLSQ